MNGHWYMGLITIGLLTTGFAHAATSAVPATPTRASQSPVLKRYELPAQYADAQCNDGSPYSIYYRPGTGEGRQRLVLWFQGGGYCQDDASCVDRWYPNSPLMSSTSWGQTRTMNSGLLSVDPAVSPLASDAVILLPYCSSDAFFGTREPFSVAELPFDLRFKGANIAEAVIDLLATAPPPNIPTLKHATRIVVAGNSAGTGGVLGHADRVTAAAGGRTDVYAVANAAWLFEYPSLNQEVLSYGGIAPYLGAITDYWDAMFDDDCQAQAVYEGTVAARGRCLIGESAAEYIDTPTFVAMAQRDPSLLQYFKPRSENVMAAAYRDSLHAASIEGAYSRNDTLHGYLQSTLGLLNGTSGASPREVFEEFLNEPGASQAFHIVP